MEMLVIERQQHRSQCYSRRNYKASNGFYGYLPRGSKGINCPSFESSPGFLQSPPSYPNSFSNFQEHKFPFSCFEPPKNRKPSVPINVKRRPLPSKDANFPDDCSCSELWAGPGYSNSPPPSSLPIPKFSLRQKRSISLELPPVSSAGVTSQPLSKSAPPSPTREAHSQATGFSHDIASATENLRRVLHLDNTDD